MATPHGSSNFGSCRVFGADPSDDTKSLLANALAAVTARTVEALLLAKTPPLQDSVKVLSPTVVGATLKEPLAACDPAHAPLALQEGAFESHVRDTASPCTIVLRATLIATIAGTCGSELPPPEPPHALSSRSPPANIGWLAAVPKVFIAIFQVGD
jgi:hypothetical protein